MLCPQPFWTVHPFDCQHVTIRNIDIWNPAHSPNTDGVDPDSCSDVLIENCALQTFMSSSLQVPSVQKLSCLS